MKYFLVCFFVACSCLAQSNNSPVNVRVWGDAGATNVPPDLTNAVSIAGGRGGHCVAIKLDGTITAWGSTDTGYWGLVPTDLTNASAIATSGGATYAIDNAGRLFAWGANANLALNNVRDAIAISTQPLASFAVLRADGTVVSSQGTFYLTNAVSVAEGLGFGLALRSDGSVAAWGSLGAPSGHNYISIAAGFYHGLALRNDGTVVAWGDNGYGQCNVPTDLTNAVAISACANFSLALRNNGTVVAWGDNGYGQKNVPSDLPFAQAIAAGETFSMAIVSPSQAPPPTIWLQPKSQTVASGAAVHFSVRATGIPPFSYQWFFNVTNQISGATNFILSLNNVAAINSGSYHAVVSNNGGGVTSQPAFLSVLPGLNINMIPAISLIGDVGTAYTLQYINAVGPTNNWQTLTTVTLTNNPQFYPDYSAIGQPTRFYRLIQGP